MINDENKEDGIFKIEKNKKKFLDLLLLADEQESMIDKYLERGEMFVLYENGLKSCCVVTDEGDQILEIKNLAVVEKFQKKGYGRKMINFIEQKYKDKYKILRVGTGETPSTLPFYLKLSFKIKYKIDNFFIDNYDHEIIEGGIKLKDMIILEKEI